MQTHPPPGEPGQGQGVGMVQKDNKRKDGFAALGLTTGLEPYLADQIFAFLAN